MILPRTGNSHSTLRIRNARRRAEELFALGPHDATFQFIIGDPNWTWKSTARLILAFEGLLAASTGFISGFYTSYDGFIDFNPTGQFEDGLQVFVYTPKNATFYGGEGRVDFHLLPLELTRPSETSDAKSVKNVIMGGRRNHAEKSRTIFICGYKPTTSTRRTAAANRSRASRLSVMAFRSITRANTGLASIEGWRVDAQNRVAEFETTHAGLHVFERRVSATSFRWGRTYNYLYARGTNLLDAEGRDHLSFLKEVLPLPGRGVVVGLRTTF